MYLPSTYDFRHSWVLCVWGGCMVHCRWKFSYFITQDVSYGWRELFTTSLSHLINLFFCFLIEEVFLFNLNFYLFVDNMTTEKHINRLSPGNYDICSHWFWPCLQHQAGIPSYRVHLTPTHNHASTTPVGTFCLAGWYCSRQGPALDVSALKKIAFCIIWTGCLSK